MKTKSFKDLIVWQKSYQLVLEICKITKDFPKDAVYGLLSTDEKVCGINAV
ncbi:MAG: four helix bundle protein [Kiritimatiellae bacterium]|nr:four helix bundle protein [Kiritimatiellia bacterium]